MASSTSTAIRRLLTTGRQTVTAFGVLSDVVNGYPMLLSDMTILTALRTAATRECILNLTGASVA